ncbi:MAG: hypothetical protein ACI350_05315 [Prevotella sp.]
MLEEIFHFSDVSMVMFAKIVLFVEKKKTVPIFLPMRAGRESGVVGHCRQRCPAVSAEVDGKVGKSELQSPEK